MSTSFSPSPSAPRAPRPRILCVDDDERLLAGLQLRLHKRFDVFVANSAAIALGKIDRRNPFAVVVSDVHMPQSNGTMLLSAMRRIAPMTVRIVLTGHADATTLLAVTNESEPFRILVKPIDGEAMLKVVDEASARHRELIEERDIVVQTLQGVGNVVAEALALASPLVAARAARIRRLAGDVCERMNPRERWIVEFAALAAHVGFLGVTGAALERFVTGSLDGPADERALERLYAQSAQLFRDLPRLEHVRDAIRLQRVRFDLANTAGTLGRPEHLSLGARILHAVTVADTLMSAGVPQTEIAAQLEERSGDFDPTVIAALRDVLAEHAARHDAHVLPLRAVTLGVRVLEDVWLPGGSLLIPRGMEVTPGVLARIDQLPNDLQLKLVRIGATAAERSATT